MEIKKEKFSWIEKVANKSFVINTDSDVIVPDTKPDIKKILQVDAHAKITSSEIQNDRILFCGNVDFHIIYLPDDDTEVIHSIKTSAPFTDVVPFKGVMPQMIGDFEADVCTVNYKIINGRKFSVKSSVEICALIGQTISAECVDSILQKDVQTKTKQVTYLSKSADYSKNFFVNENIIIPQSEASATSVIKVLPTLNEYSIKVISNKVILKGEIKLSCAYTNTVDEEIKVVGGIVPFTEILDVDGIKSDDMCNLKVAISDNTYNCQEDSNGEIRGIEVSTEILVKLFALRETQVNVVNDCYSTTESLKGDVLIANLPQKINVIDYQQVYKAQIELKDSEPKINKVYDIFSKAYIEKTEQTKDKLNVSGTIDNYVLYTTNQKDLPIYCARNEIEFSESFDCGDALADGFFNINALNTSYVLSGTDSIELRVNVKIDGVMWQEEKTEMITDVTVENVLPMPDIASITVYFVQENDSLWDIAKKYFTTVDAIKKINDGLGDNVQKGMQLLIPKYKLIG